MGSEWVIERGRLLKRGGEREREKEREREIERERERSEREKDEESMRIGKEGKSP